jgi:tRNA1(Val) A37 N6-methylase TrmN6
VSAEGLTLDRFLGGRIVAAQPSGGFRAGHDTVLLAAAVPAESGSIALELGSGVGIASLCLAVRVSGVRIIGIEIDPELVRLANDNAAHNNVADRVSFLSGDAGAGLDASTLQSTSPLWGEPAPDLIGGRTAVARQRESGSGGGLFDHVFFNPPFHPDSAHSSPIASRDRATRDSSDAVRTWTERALPLVRDGGTVTAIVRADRVDDVLDAARGYSGLVFPLFPRAGAAPKRVIIRIIKTERISPTPLPSPLVGEGAHSAATCPPKLEERRQKQRVRGRKGGDTRDHEHFVTAAGLILHESDGRNTEAAEAVLRHGKPLNLMP